MKYTVLERGFKTHKAGATVELDEKEARVLVKLGRLAPANASGAAAPVVKPPDARNVDRVAYQDQAAPVVPQEAPTPAVEDEAPRRRGRYARRDMRSEGYED